MNVAVRIDYITENENRITQQGSFPQKGRTHEEVAYEFWRMIKREMPSEIFIERVMADGVEITDKVKEIEERNGVYIPEDTLKEMKDFFMKTSIPRILENKKKTPLE
jgi:hypothetical protein